MILLLASSLAAAALPVFPAPAARVEFPIGADGVEVWEFPLPITAFDVHESLGDAADSVGAWAVRERADVRAWRLERFVVVAAPSGSSAAQGKRLATVLDGLARRLADERADAFVTGTLEPYVLHCRGDYQGPATAAAADPCVRALLEGVTVPDLGDRTLSLSLAAARAEAREVLSPSWIAEVQAIAQTRGSLAALWAAADRASDPVFLGAVSGMLAEELPPRSCGAHLTDYVFGPPDRRPACQLACGADEPQTRPGAPFPTQAERRAAGAACETATVPAVVDLWREQMDATGHAWLRDLVVRVERAPRLAWADFEVRLPRLAWVMAQRADAPRDLDLLGITEQLGTFDQVVTSLERSMSQVGWGRDCQLQVQTGLAYGAPLPPAMSGLVLLPTEGVTVQGWAGVFAGQVNRCLRCALDPRAATPEGWTLPWSEVAGTCRLEGVPPVPPDRPWPAVVYAWHALQPALAASTPAGRARLEAWLADPNLLAPRTSP